MVGERMSCYHSSRTFFGRAIARSFFSMARALDRHWLKPMFRIHPTQLPPVPLYYSSLQSLSSRGAAHPFMRHQQQGLFLHSYMPPQSRYT